MRRVLIAMSAMFALSLPLSAAVQGQSNTIGSIRSDCVILLSDAASDQMKLGQKGRCLGWIMAEAGWRMNACHAKRANDTSTTFTQAARDFDGHSYGAMAQAFVNFANKNPQYWSEPTSLLMWNMFVFSEFPCWDD